MSPSLIPDARPGPSSAASPGASEVRLDLPVLAQPDDVTCGPTCLHAVYRHYGDELPIQAVVDEVEQLAGRGTLAVMLGCHALERGYRATIHTANLVVFDPTWFADPGVELAERLREQAAAKDDPRIRVATRAYLRFLALGGVVRYAEMEPALLAEPLLRGVPVLTGLSATYLYRCARELERDGRMVYDDVRGEPVGHFVVLTGYDPAGGRVWIADPLHENPAFGEPVYAVPVQRALAAILMGALTYDANLLILEPPGSRADPPAGKRPEPCSRSS